VYGIALINCIFIGNSGSVDLYRSSGTGQTNFQLTNCFFSRSPLANIYTVISNVVISTTTATYLIGHFNTQVCPAECIFSSETFSLSSINPPTKSIAVTQELSASKGLFARTASPPMSIHFVSVLFQESRKYRTTAAFDVTVSFSATIRPALTVLFQSRDPLPDTALLSSVRVGYAESNGFSRSVHLLSSSEFNHSRVLFGETAVLGSPAALPWTGPALTLWLADTEDASVTRDFSTSPGLSLCLSLSLR
jgi:hypothetical protein